MPIDPDDAALLEVAAVREELRNRLQGESTIFTAALTAIAAIGGFALSDDGRLEMLLVLPLILSGLGLLIVQGTQGNQNMATYIRDRWDAIRPGGGFESWEHHIQARREEHGRRIDFAVTALAPILLIFVLPAVAASIIGADSANADLEPLVLAGRISIVVFVGFGLLMAWRTTRPAAGSSSARQRPRRDKT